MLFCVPLSGQNSSRDQELSIFIITRIFKLLSLNSLLALSLITLGKQAYFVGPMEPNIEYSSGGNYTEAVSQVLLKANLVKISCKYKARDPSMEKFLRTATKVQKFIQIRDHSQSNP